MSTTKLTVGLLGAGLILGLAGCGEKDGDDSGGNGVTEDCSNNIDDDQDGATDCLDEDCAAEAVCLEEEDCSDGVDGPDQDGLVDCEDNDCGNDEACVFFEPTALGFSFNVGYSDGDLTGYSYVVQGQAGTVAAPYAIFQLFEEDYFIDGDDRYVCRWAADIIVDERTVFGANNLFDGWSFHLEENAQLNSNIEANGYTVCNDLDPDAGWGEATPATVFENLGTGALGLGLGTDISNDLRSWIISGVGQASYDADWDGQVFGGYIAFGGTVATSSSHYCLADQADESMAIQYDEAGNSIPMWVGEEGLVAPDGVDDLGPYYVVSCGTYNLYNLTALGL